jgi:hypothetical protein
MTQIFTDERFPGFEIHNDGTNTFHVFEVHGGTTNEVDTFTTFSDHPEYKIAPEAAEKQARGYFDRLSRWAQHDNTGNEGHGDPMRSRDAAPEVGDKAVGLSDLLGGNILSPDDVMAAYEKASAINDPEQHRRAMEQVRQMSSRLESAADEIVRRLID